MREAGKAVARILKSIEDIIAPGIVTMELEELANKKCKEMGVKPAFKGYRGYPYALCISVNEQVVHGFPSKRRLKKGDIVSLDFGVIKNGYYGDAALTVPVGEVERPLLRLLEVTEKALYKGLSAIKPGGRVSDISHAIQQFVEGHGYSVVRRFVGHGIGRNLHEDPQIPNFGPPGQGEVLKEGMTLAVEPMVNMGGEEVEILKDGWTAVTKDGSFSAHFEHTVVVTSNGYEILTDMNHQKGVMNNNG